MGQPEPGEKRASTPRIEQLDALRGLAALSVVFYHHFQVYPLIANAIVLGASFPESLLFWPPVFLFWSGHSAVLLFFALSGYVLMLPVLQKRQPDYPHYVLKRICRIYLPYLPAVIVPIMLVRLLAPQPIPELGWWFKLSWAALPDRWDLLNHILMLPKPNTQIYNGVVWSLVHEMRISIVFPFLAALVVRLRWWQNVVLAMFLALPGGFAPVILSNKIVTYYALSLHYAGVFVVGGVLAKHRTQISLWLRTKSTGFRCLLLAVGVLLYTSYGLDVTVRNGRWHHQFEYLITIGSLILIVYANSTEWLKRESLAWLGRISYSLYLWHLPVLLAVVRFGYGKMPLWSLLLISIVIGLLIAWLMYLAIEKPSTRLAKRIGRTGVVTIV
jgi:peptidoglycan/LPS O-acetylase OafA/YrhL